MKKLKFIVFYIVFSLLAFGVRSQTKNIETQQLFWLRYHLKLKLHENYQIKQEFEERVYIPSLRQHQFVSRTFVERKLGKSWNTGLGLTYSSLAFPQNPEIADFTTQAEWRPFFEMAYKQILTEKLFFHHRYWNEFRFFEQDDKSFQFENLRMRYKFEISYSPFQNLTLNVFNEILLNVGKKVVKNVFDQNRYGFSVRYMPLKSLGIELGYFNWFQQRKSGIDFYDRHIFRFTIHQNINFNKK